MKYKVPTDAINLHNATEVYTACLKHFERKEDMVIDCTSVQSIDTSGIAVLFSWCQDALGLGISCHFELSSKVVETLHVYDLELP